MWPNNEIYDVKPNETISRILEPTRPLNKIIRRTNKKSKKSNRIKDYRFRLSNE